jgi:hypothetical protein
MKKGVQMNVERNSPVLTNQIRDLQERIASLEVRCGSSKELVDLWNENRLSNERITALEAYVRGEISIDETHDEAIRHQLMKDTWLKRLADIEADKERLIENLERLSNLENRIAAIEAKGDKHIMVLESKSDKFLAKLSATLEALEQRIAALEQRVITLWDQEINKRITALEADRLQADYRVAVDESEKRITAILALLKQDDEASLRIAHDFESRIAVLEADNNVAHGETLSDHALRIATHDQRIATLEQQLKELTAIVNLNEINSEDYDIHERLAALEAKMEHQEFDARTLELLVERVDTSDKRIAALEEAINTTSGKI